MWRKMAVMAAGILLGTQVGWLSAADSCSRTYTLNADFDEGNYLNVTHAVPDQLQLNAITEAKPKPFVWIACSSRGTVVRIDVNTGQIQGEYYTAPNNRYRNPSRTTVDKFGSVWVANRDESSGGQGSVTRIALIIGGTRCNADGTPNPAGQYLKPPFDYSTAVDKNGDGLIKTSLGLGNILPWANASGVDHDGGVETAEDECIINYTRVTGTGTRTVAVDANNDVWVGGLGDLDHEKISGVTGQPVPGTQFNAGAGGYGGLIDGNGVLWSARGGSGLLRFVPNPTPPPAGTWTALGSSGGDYGLGIDPQTGNIWHSTYARDSRVYVRAPSGAVLASYPQGNYYAQGVAVDGLGNVWIAHSVTGPATTVGHLRTTGLYVGTVGTASGPSGVAVDANGKIWVACYYGNVAQRIDPNAGAVGAGGFKVGAVDMTVSLGANANPYNYSDMTGSVLLGALFQGSWNVVRNSGAAGTLWGIVSWTAAEPAGTDLKVEVRASDNAANLPSTPFVEVGNGVPFCTANIVGQFIEARVSFTGNITTKESPVLYDLTVASCDTEPPAASCAYQKTTTGYIATLNATDNCETMPAIFLMESGPSPFIAGPFYASDKVVVRVNPIQAPFYRPAASGPYKGLLQVRNLPLIYAVDARGNVSVPHACYP
jgi:streptogramin lyase